MSTSSEPEEVRADAVATLRSETVGTVDKVLKRGGDPDNGYAGKVLRGS